MEMDKRVPEWLTLHEDTLQPMPETTLVVDRVVNYLMDNLIGERVSLGNKTLPIPLQVNYDLLC